MTSRGQPTRTPRAWALAAASTALAIAACGGNVMTRDPSVGDVTDQSTVAVEGDPAGKRACDGTMFVDWADGTSDAISSAKRDGLVVVKSAGCKLEVLATCHGEGAYDFVSVTPTRDRTEVSADNALRLGVEFGDGKHVGAEAGQGSGRSIEFAIVGQDMAKASPKSLKGQCAGATHYVSAIAVGAYGVGSTSHSEVTAVVKLHDKKNEEHHGAGDLDKCSKSGAASDDACKTPLKIDLSPLAKGLADAASP